MWQASAMSTETRMPRAGRFVIRWATAAGVTMSANIKSTPTTCTAMEVATAMRSIKATPIQKMETPFASATSSSSEVNKSGRYKMATATRRTSAAMSVTSTSPLEIPKISPNKQRIGLRGIAGIQTDEKDAETEHEREHGPDLNIAARGFSSKHRYRKTAAARENEKSHDRIHAEENGAGGAGKTDMGQRMRGERRPAQEQ